MRNKVPLEDIAQTLLYRGFTKGLWTPDLIVLLIEPVIYILINLAEYAEIKFVLYPEDDTVLDDPFESEDDRASALTSMLGKDTETVDKVTADMPVPKIVPQSLMDRIQTAVDGGDTENV